MIYLSMADLTTGTWKGACICDSREDAINRGLLLPNSEELIIDIGDDEVAKPHRYRLITTEAEIEAAMGPCGRVQI